MSKASSRKGRVVEAKIVILDPGAWHDAMRRLTLETALRWDNTVPVADTDPTYVKVKIGRRTYDACIVSWTVSDMVKPSRLYVQIQGLADSGFIIVEVGRMGILAPVQRYVVDATDNTDQLVRLLMG